MLFGCNCRWTEIVIAVIIFVLAISPDLLGIDWSLKLVAVAAIALVIHAFLCDNCGCPVDGGEKAAKGK